MEKAVMESKLRALPQLGKIFVLIGKAASGKTELIQDLERELGIKRVVGATSRPARPGEIEGVHNNFLKKEEFVPENFIEIDEFNGWMYGTPKSSIKDGENCLIILTPDGYRKIKGIYGDRVIGIYIMAPEEDRFERYVRRDGDYDEARRRFLADFIDFHEFEYEADKILINNKEYKDLVYKALDLITKELFIN